MAATLQLLSIISFAVAAACFAVAVFLWFFFKIPDVIGDLSGRTARKSIARMRAANEKSGVKSYRESRLNVERGKLTGTMPGIGKRESTDDGKTETVSPESEPTALLTETGTTALLVDEGVTAPLNEETEKKPEIRTGGKKVKVLEEIMIIHTDEVIE